MAATGGGVMKDTLTTLEVALAANCNPRRVQAAVRTGELPAARIGKGYVYLREDVLDWIRHHYSRTHSA